MNLKQFDFKFNILWSLIAALLIYVVIVGIVILNLTSIVDASRSPQKNAVVEALLYPKGVPNVAEVFNADPLLTSIDNEAVVEIRKGISFLVFSSLFHENIGGTVSNDLAQDYEFKEAKNLRLKIRENILWQDGERLTIDDVIFTMNLIRSVGQSGLYYGAVNGGDISFKPLGDFEMEVDLIDQAGPKPNAAYLQELTFPILPKHLLQDYTNPQILNLSQSEFGKNPVGSGKFRYLKTSSKELELAQNEDYYEEGTKFDRYIFRFYRNEKEVLDNYFLKNIDVYTSRGIIEDNSLEDKLTRESSSFTTILKDINYVLYFNLNEDKLQKAPLLKSLSLRNGLQKVVNRDNIQTRLKNKARLVYGPIDQSSWAYTSETQEEQKLDIEDFKKRAENLGYSKKGEYYQKDGEILGFTLSYVGGDIREVVVTQIKEDLKLAGIEVRLDQINKAESNESNDNTGRITGTRKISDILNNRNFEAILTSINQFQDPDRFNQWHYTKIDPPGLNISSFDSNVANLMLSQGRTESDQEKRKEKYIRFQRSFIQEVPAIYLLNAYTTTYYSKRLSNLEIDMINNNEYKYQNINEWRVKGV